jgi:hypothetical protein
MIQIVATTDTTKLNSFCIKCKESLSERDLEQIKELQGINTSFSREFGRRRVLPKVYESGVVPHWSMLPQYQLGPSEF